MKKYDSASESIEIDRILAKDFLTILLFSSASSIGTAIAEEAPATLPPMVVAAPHADSDETDQNGDVRKRAMSVDNRDNTYLTQQDLSIAHERSVDEVLRGLPGLGVTKGGNFGLGMIYARGASGQGLVTLDGLPVPDTLPGVINLNALFAGRHGTHRC